jgi:heterodisulfide reductase subunit A-like polyferredoxin
VKALKSVVMIQCVGPAEQYCSRICCTTALKNALALKKINPALQITIFYIDIRVYGFKEKLYANARENGILFVRYDRENAPRVETGGEHELMIKGWDPILHKEIELEADLLVLSMPVVPPEDIDQLSALFKVPVDAQGFFQEAHVKLRPVDFATNGIFMAGNAHYPKLLDETLVQAQAAAGRAVRILSQASLSAGGRVAVVDESLCTGCLTCVRICPFDVPRIQASRTGVGNILGAAFIEPAVCQGCGSCVAECPAHAIQLMHYTDTQIMAKVTALVNPAFVPQEAIGVSEVSHG